MSPKLLLVTRYFPPLDSIATMRMYSWAHYLKTFGYDVTVLTTTKQNQIHHPLALDTTGIRVCEVAYFDPIASVGGSRAQVASGVSPLHRFYRQRMNERMPNRTDFWIRPAVKELQRQHAAGIRYDYIISSYGPPSSHIVGRFAKRRFGGRWLADYRDLWIENHVYKGLWPFTRFERWVEKSCVSRADLLTTVSEGLKSVLQAKFSHLPVHVVTNGFESQLIDEATSDFFPPDGTFRIVYTGSLYQGQRDVTPLCKAISELAAERKLHPGQLEVIFYGSIMGDLLALIEKYQVEPWMRHGGALSLTEAYRAQKSADALLFVERGGVEGVLTGKLFEYLYAPPPILAIGVTPEMESGRLIESTGCGGVCGNDVPLIKQQLLEMISGRYQANKKRDCIAQYSRKEQAHKIHHLLQSI